MVVKGYQGVLRGGGGGIVEVATELTATLSTAQGVDRTSSHSVPAILDVVVSS